MKIHILLIICVCLLFSAGAINAQSGIDAFLAKFKAAVKKRDKAAVANMTKFPLSMPYGMRSVKTRADFFKRFNIIFNGEADAARCFEAEKPFKRDNRYEIACTFKSNPETSEDRPIVYEFEMTGKGWMFAGLDNINE